MTPPDLTALVLKAVEEYNEQLPPQQRIALEPEAIVFSRNGPLDSLGLVNLILLIEDAIEDSTGERVTLADERALSQKRSPFRTVATLAEYAGQLLAEKTGA